MDQATLEREMKALCSRYQAALSANAAHLDAEGQRTHVEAALLVAVANLRSIAGTIGAANALTEMAETMRAQAAAERDAAAATELSTRH